MSRVGRSTPPLSSSGNSIHALDEDFPHQSIKRYICRLLANGTLSNVGLVEQLATKLISGHADLLAMDKAKLLQRAQTQHVPETLLILSQLGYVDNGDSLIMPEEDFADKRGAIQVRPRPRERKVFVPDTLTMISISMSENMSH